MWRIRTGILVCAAVAVTALACSSSANDEPGGGPSNGASPTIRSTSTPRATATATPRPATAAASPTASPRVSATTGPGSGGGPAGEGRNALIASLSKLDKDNYHVVYRIETTDAGQPFGGTFALASKGEKSLFLMEIDSSEGAFIIATVYDGEKTYFCLGGDDPDNPGQLAAACFEGDDDDGPSNDDFPFLNFEAEIMRMAADGEAEVNPAPDRRVGLFDSRCWEITDDSGTGTACVAKSNGFLVLVDGEFDGSRVFMEVENYTDKPDDSVFKPPYPVESFVGEDD